MNIRIKRIYEQAEEEDGYRILVDRLWPRGIKKEEARINEWSKHLAPSTDLRKWFGHEQKHFEKFTERYITELQGKKDELLRIKRLAENKVVTLLYAAKDTRINHAVVLQKLLESLE